MSSPLFRPTPQTEPPITWAIVPAGGNGSRFSTQQNKLWAKLAGKPIVVHTLQALLETPGIQGVILTANASHLPLYAKELSTYLDTSRLQLTAGGATRRESVYLGLQALPHTVEWVVIHDAARPLISPKQVQQAIQAVHASQRPAILAVPVTDSIKQAKPSNLEAAQIDASIPRHLLWNAQTPQIFPKHLLRQAHQQAPLDLPITDDAQLLEVCQLGRVDLLPGTPDNLKITTPIDLLIAEAFLQARQAAHLL